MASMSISQSLLALGFHLVATTFEVSGNAVVRRSIYNQVGIARLGLMLAGAALLFGIRASSQPSAGRVSSRGGTLYRYSFRNLADHQFHCFRTLPNLPVSPGGTLIVAGGLIVTFWRAT